MSAINPATIWLSDHILLSDMIGCDSVYRHGIPNPVTESDKAKINEGMYLAETIEPYVKERAVSFTYGYISPGLSRAIVKYQNPNKKSYHRWDDGAACDMVCHNEESLRHEHHYVDQPWSTVDTARNHYPLVELHRMFGEYGIRWSRAITYAESDVFCIGARRGEGLTGHRMATYENKFTGERQPDFQKIPAKMFENGIPAPPKDWRGRGWPHTHGGGRRQYEHVRIGSYSLLSDFLYDPICTHKGIPNRPPLGRRMTDRFMLNMFLASLAYENLVFAYGERLPIVAAYVNPNARRTKLDRSYQDRFVFDIRPPRGAHPDDIMDLPGATFCDAIRKVTIQNGTVRVYGYPLEQITNDEPMTMAAARYELEREHFKRGSKL